MMQLGRVPLDSPPIKAAHTPRRLLGRLWSLRCTYASRQVRSATSVQVTVCEAERFPAKLQHYPVTPHYHCGCDVLFSSANDPLHGARKRRSQLRATTPLHRSLCSCECVPSTKSKFEVRRRLLSIVLTIKSR